MEIKYKVFGYTQYLAWQFLAYPRPFGGLAVADECSCHKICGGFTNQNVRYIMDIKRAIADVLCPINIGHKITPNKLKDIFS